MPQHWVGRSFALQFIFVILFQFLTATPLVIANPLPPETLENAIRDTRHKNPYFTRLAELAKKYGFRVYLFGGTATSFARYVHWDLELNNGDNEIDASRFDYQLENIYRPQQDIDIAIESMDSESENPDQIRNFEVEARNLFYGRSFDILPFHTSYTNLAGKKRMAILNNPDYLNQHNDSLSSALIALSENSPSLIKDIRSSENRWIKDLANEESYFLFSENHSTTSRSLANENPPIFSVIRYLSKIFRYDLKIPPESEHKIKAIIENFNPIELPNGYVRNWIEFNAKKIILQAQDLEAAWNYLEDSGLRKKLIQVFDNAELPRSLAWYLNREPLRTHDHPSSRSLYSAGSKRSILDHLRFNPKVATHETTDLIAYDSITRNRRGKINAFVSINAAGQTAKLGDGFYVREGSRGDANSIRTGLGGFHITLKILPGATEGPDFERVYDPDFKKEHLIFKNAKHLKVISQSSKHKPLEIVNALLTLEHKDFGLAQRLLRQLDQISLTPQDRDQIDELLKTATYQFYRPRHSYEYLKKMLYKSFEHPEDFLRAISFFTKPDPKQPTRPDDVARSWILARLDSFFSLDPNFEAVRSLNEIFRSHEYRIQALIDAISQHFRSPDDLMRFTQLFDAAEERSSLMQSSQNRFFSMKPSVADIRRFSLADIKAGPMATREAAIKAGLIHSSKDFVDLSGFFSEGDRDKMKDDSQKMFVNFILKYIPLLVSLSDFKVADIHELCRTVVSRERKIAIKKELLKYYRPKSVAEWIELLFWEHNNVSTEYQELLTQLGFNYLDEIFSLLPSALQISDLTRIFWARNGLQNPKLRFSLKERFFKERRIQTAQDLIDLLSHEYSPPDDRYLEQTYEAALKWLPWFVNQRPSMKQIHDFVLTGYEYDRKIRLKAELINRGLGHNAVELSEILDFELKPPSSEYRAETQKLIGALKGHMLAIDPNPEAWSQLLDRSFEMKVDFYDFFKDTKPEKIKRPEAEEPPSENPELLTNTKNIQMAMGGPIPHVKKLSLWTSCVHRLSKLIKRIPQ